MVDAPMAIDIHIEVTVVRRNCMTTDNHKTVIKCEIHNYFSQFNIKSI